jgi:hypothetical protein
MNHIIYFLLLQLDPEEKVKFSNTLMFSDKHYPSVLIQAKLIKKVKMNVI